MRKGGISPGREAQRHHRAVSVRGVTCLRGGDGDTVPSGVTIQHPALPIPRALGCSVAEERRKVRASRVEGSSCWTQQEKKQLPNCASLLAKGHGREVTRCWHQHRNTWQGQGRAASEGKQHHPKLLQPLGAQPGLQLLLILPELFFLQRGPDTSLQQC